MSEKTLGQAAYEAWFHAAHSGFLSATASSAEEVWARGSGDWHATWEAAAKAAVTAGAPAELAAAMGETRKVADAASAILAEFKRGSDGYRARLSGVNLMRAYKAIGRPLPDCLRHMEGQ